jgi:hypothetical protein
MTAVQWWCSGVVLNRIFSSASSQCPLENAPASQNVAAGHDYVTQSVQAESSPPSGQEFDSVG